MKTVFNLLEGKLYRTSWLILFYPRYSFMKFVKDNTKNKFSQNEVYSLFTTLNFRFNRFHICSTTDSFRKKFTTKQMNPMFEPLILEYNSHPVRQLFWFILVQNLDENYKRFIIGRSWRERIGWEEEEAHLQKVCIQRSWSGPAIGHVQVCFNRDMIMMWHVMHIITSVNHIVLIIL